MYERILVPLDGSELAEAAIPFAELIPSRQVRVLWVEPSAGTTRRVTAKPALERSEGTEPPDLAHEEPTARAKEYLAGLTAGLRRQGRDVELAVADGDPRAQIIAAAVDAGLIVMGTRGRGVGGQTLGESTADHVVRNARVPTLLVRGALSQVAPSVGRIVVPLDGSERAEMALPTAARLTSLLGVRPHLVRVVLVSPSRTDTDARRREAAAYLDGQAMRLASADLFATREALAGPIVSTLLEAIRSTDLVVMTALGQGGERQEPLGSVAERLVSEADGPILLLH